MAELEFECGEIILSNIYHSLPVVKSVVGQDLEIIFESESCKDCFKLRHSRSERGSDHHDVGDVSWVRADGNGKMRLFEGCANERARWRFSIQGPRRRWDLNGIWHGIGVLVA